MKEIILTQGQIALVDDEDYEWLMQWKWHIIRGRRKIYAVRKTKDKKSIFMHRAVFERHGIEIPEGMEIDHRNGDGLDNEKNNLRVASRQQNQMNKNGNKNSSSKYKGVSWNTRNKRWHSSIKIKGEKTYLGCLKDEKEAALAYNKAAIIHFGEFANLNIVDSSLHNA